MINLFKARKVIQPLIKPDLEEINQNPENKKREGPLKDQVFVFTGVFDSFDRVDAEEIAKKYGARVVSGISGRTTYLVYGEKLEDGRNYTEGRKYKNSIERETIKIISEDEYRSLLAMKCNWTEFKEAAKGDVPQKTVQVTVQNGEKQTMREQVIRNDAESWLDKYRPVRLEDMVGNNNIASNAYEWCKNWYDMFITKVYNKSNLPGSVNNRAMLLIGPSGVGKTHLIKTICHKLDLYMSYVTITSIKSGKALRESKVWNLAKGNRVIEKYCTSSQKALIMFDDVDGLGDADSGFVNALCELIPLSKHPIVITAESATKSKMKRLIKVCYDLRLKSPNKQQVAKYLFRIIKHENMTADGNALEEIVERSGHDIRASIINLQMNAALTNSIKFDNLYLNCFRNVKVGFSVYETAQQFLNGYIYDQLPMNEKVDSFREYENLLPSFIYENYLDAFGEIQVSGDQNRLADVAEFCALGDYIDTYSKSSNGWFNNLRNDYGLVSCLTTACYVKGVITNVQFPKVFLDTQEYCKNVLECEKVNITLKNAKVIIDDGNLIPEFIPYFNHILFTHMIYNSIHSVVDVSTVLSDCGMTFDFYKNSFNELEWKNESPEYYLYNNFNYENKKPLVNKFLLVDNDTLIRIKKKVQIQGQLVDRAAVRSSVNTRAKKSNKDDNLQGQVSRILNDTFTENMMQQDIVNIEKSHYKVYKKPSTLNEKINSKRKRL